MHSVTSFKMEKKKQQSNIIGDFFFNYLISAMYSIYKFEQVTFPFILSLKICKIILSSQHFSIFL